MQCDYPGAGPVVVSFPGAAKLPRAFAAGSVRLDAKKVATEIKGRNVTVKVPPHKGCSAARWAPAH